MPAPKFIVRRRAAARGELGGTNASRDPKNEQRAPATAGRRVRRRSRTKREICNACGLTWRSQATTHNRAHHLRLHSSSYFGFLSHARQVRTHHHHHHDTFPSPLTLRMDWSRKRIKCIRILLYDCLVQSSFELEFKISNGFSTYESICTKDCCKQRCSTYEQTELEFFHFKSYGSVLC